MSTALPPIADLRPRQVTTLHGNPGRVMQSFTRAPWDGTYYEAQVEAEAPVDMRISRCDQSGNVLDFAVLHGAGHGSSITAEYSDGRVYIWLWWNIDSTTGQTMTPVRWAYSGTPDGASVNLADTETLTLPAGVIPGHFAIDQAKDRIATYSRSGNTETLKLWTFSDFRNGTGSALKTATLVKPDRSSFQGFTTSDTAAYISRGGSAPDDVAPILYEVGWDAGGVTGTKDISGLVLGPGGVAPGGHNEAEGVCLWRDQAGNPTLLFGVVTGPAQQREGRIYAMTAPVDGTATKTVRIDAENVTGGKAENVVASFRYSTTVRSTNGGFTPTSYEEPVKLSESDTVQLKVSDHPDLTDDCFGFVIYGRLDWDDPSNPGRRKTAAYTAQLSAADPDLVLLSQRLVASGAVAPGQVIKGTPGHSPVVTMVGDQIAVDGVVQGDHLTADATAAEQAAAQSAADAAQSAQDAANSAALVGAPADAAIATAVNGSGTNTQAALNAFLNGLSTRVNITIPAGAGSNAAQHIVNNGASYGLKVDQSGSDGPHDTVNIAANFGGAHTPFSVNSLNQTLSTAKIVNSGAQTGGAIVAAVGDNPARSAALFNGDNYGTGPTYLSTAHPNAQAIAFEATYDPGTMYTTTALWINGNHTGSNLALIENAQAHTSGAMLRINQKSTGSNVPSIYISNSGTGDHITADNFSVTKAGLVKAGAVYNYASFNNARLQLNSTGSIIDRNVADSNATLKIANANANNTGDTLQILGAGGVLGSRFDANAYFKTNKSSAPADSSILAGEVAIWFDSTPGATKVTFRGKDSGGTVRTGTVTLS